MMDSRQAALDISAAVTHEIWHWMQRKRQQVGDPFDGDSLAIERKGVLLFLLRDIERLMVGSEAESAASRVDRLVRAALKDEAGMTWMSRVQAAIDRAEVKMDPPETLHEETDYERAVKHDLYQELELFIRRHIQHAADEAVQRARSESASTQ